MVIISRVLAWHSESNLFVTDKPCLLGHRVKKERIVCGRTCREITTSYMDIAIVRSYIAG